MSGNLSEFNLKSQAISPKIILPKLMRPKCGFSMYVGLLNKTCSNWNCQYLARQISAISIGRHNIEDRCDRVSQSATKGPFGSVQVFWPVLLVVLIILQSLLV